MVGFCFFPPNGRDVKQTKEDTVKAGGKRQVQQFGQTGQLGALHSKYYIFNGFGSSNMKILGKNLLKSTKNNDL